MRASIRKGFTLVEILIVVVILGILAAIVVPQFTSASQEAIKGALNSQLQTINSQVELYRVQNAGVLPHNDNDNPMLVPAEWNGWGVLVEDDYLKSEPRNGYTRTRNIVANTFTVNPDTDGTAAGWTYNNTTGQVAANGYNHVDNILASDDNTLGGWTPW
ncbi:MAG: prepilin-type N-terminal cleavage/methylation domain-containing protein [Phycisphaeraceae bacterium]|nr:MAG: prepilin-type N-terminal cleavage/methylation domain-containing protein [Phycisphaeraceae bacterium]